MAAIFRVRSNLCWYSFRSNSNLLSNTTQRLRQGLPKKWPLPGVKRVILVASGKGGVGKSTTAVNIAVAMSNASKKVGLLDADVYGPSLPQLMSLSGQPQLTSQNRMIPLTNYGVKCMSMGFLVNDTEPIVWRGLMVMSAIQKLLRQVEWGLLDVLVIDMPPGTGDTQLTISQLVPISGVVIVTTPQDLALSDARRGTEMFRKVDIPVLGVIENMSSFICPHCKQSSTLFGEGGAQRMAKEVGIKVIGTVPLDGVVCRTSDIGQPITVSKPTSQPAISYQNIAETILKMLPPCNEEHKTTTK